MLARFSFFLGLLGLVALLHPARSPAADTTPPPTLVIRISSLDGLIADFKYLAVLTGHEAEAKGIDDAIKSRFPKGFAGVDTKRPLGVYATLKPEGNLQLDDLTGALMVPVADEKAFLGLLLSRNVKLDKDEDGVYGGVLPVGQLQLPIYLRFAHKYAYITIKDKADLAPSKLLTPGKVLDMRQAEVASVSFQLDKIPMSIRQVLQGNIEVRLSDVESQKEPNESASQHALKAQVARELSRQVGALLKEGGEIAVRVDLDRQAGALAVEASVAGIPQSKLAAAIAGLAESHSLFAGLAAGDSAMKGQFHAALPEELRKALGPVIDEAIRTGLEKETDKTKRAREEKFLKALTPTLKASELDTAFVLRRSTGSEHYTLVAGIKIHDGAELEQTLREIVKDLPDEVRSRIHIDAESVGNVKIHRLDVQKDFDAEALRNLGDNPLFLAFRNDAMFVAGGDQGLKALQEALSIKPGPVPYAQFEVSLSRLAPVMAKTKKADPAEMIQKAFGGTGTGNDTVRFSIEGGKSLKLRVDLKTPVIKFFSLMDQGNQGK
jgi:hypothetical protein